MFETTTELVLETPFAVIALLPALYVTAIVLWRARRPLMTGFVSFAIIGLFPVFLLFVIGEFTGSSLWLSLGTTLFEIEAATLGGVVGLYDGVLAAWLRLCMLLVDGLLSMHLLPLQLRSTGGTESALPAWLWAFVLHFVGGAMLVYGLHRGRSESMTDTTLRGGGGVFLVSGLFVALLNSQSGPIDSSVTVVLLMAVVGLEIGVAVVLLGVRPDFSGGKDDEDAPPVEKLRESVQSRLSGLKQRLVDVTQQR